MITVERGWRRFWRRSSRTAWPPTRLQLRGKRLLLFYNARPQGEGIHPFAIGMAVSEDSGATWRQRQPTVFVGGARARSGCWEPAAIQLPSGEIQLFFANEFPYQNSDEQEISLCRSLDGGNTWSQPQTVSFRPGCRDGMPVPLLLQGDESHATHNEATIAVAIEDNGLAANSNRLQPAIVTSSLKDCWRGPPVGGNNARRWGAVTPPLGADVYAGAPYLRQLPGGETLLSCQSTEGRQRLGDKTRARMVVYVGDRHAKHFTNRSVPFDVAETQEGLWNSLAVKDADTVTALSSTVLLGVRGLWAIDGRAVREK